MHATFKDRPARDRFLRDNIEAVYHTLTDGLTRFVRVEALVRLPPRLIRGWCRRRTAWRRRLGGR